MCTHLWLKVIGGYFWRGRHDPSFPFKWQFPSTAEEEGDMRVFFRFSNPDLALAMHLQYFPKGMGKVIISENNVHMFEGAVVFSHCGIR